MLVNISARLVGDRKCEEAKGQVLTQWGNGESDDAQRGHEHGRGCRQETYVPYGLQEHLVVPDELQAAERRDCLKGPPPQIEGQAIVQVDHVRVLVPIRLRDRRSMVNAIP